MCCEGPSSVVRMMLTLMAPWKWNTIRMRCYCSPSCPKHTNSCICIPVAPPATVWPFGNIPTQCARNKAVIPNRLANISSLWGTRLRFTALLLLICSSKLNPLFRTSAGLAFRDDGGGGVWVEDQCGDAYSPNIDIIKPLSPRAESEAKISTFDWSVVRRVNVRKRCRFRCWSPFVRTHACVFGVRARGQLVLRRQLPSSYVFNCIYLVHIKTELKTSLTCNLLLEKPNLCNLHNTAALKTWSLFYIKTYDAPVASYVGETWWDSSTPALH